jgi:hypothetical protein
MYPNRGPEKESLLTCTARQRDPSGARSGVEAGLGFTASPEALRLATVPY